MQSGFKSGIIVSFLTLILITACVSIDESANSNYGDSVRHMIALQTSNPTGGAMGLDGQKAALTLQKYRQDVAVPKDVDIKEIGTSKATAGLEQSK